MSQIRANSIVNADADGPVNFPLGATGLGQVSSAAYADVAGIATNATNAANATNADNALLASNATVAQALTGTPDIAVRNIVAVGATFTGDVSIGGSISYQDVTDVNAVGVITATKGIDIRSNTLTDTTVFRYQYQYIDDEGSSRDESVSFDRVQTGAINTDNSPNTSLVTAGAVVASTVAAAQNLSGNPIINVAGVNATGVVTATSLEGDGSSLTGVETIPTFTLGADGTNNYTFTGPGLTGAENDPTLYLTKGVTYHFVNNMGAHPFRIQSTPNGSAGTDYNDGITNNDVSNGTLTWNVQFDAPDTLYYQCTAHPNMGGIIYIGDQTRTLPNNAQNSAYTLIATDTGKLINITSGDVTVPSGIFEIGSLTTIYNNKAGTMSITASGVTLRKGGTSDTGSLTIEQYGTASILCVASNEFVVTGNLA